MSRGTTGAQVLARARVHDPLASVRAARFVNASGAANTQAGWFLDAVTHQPGRTASELAAASGGKYDRYQANRRLADLKRAGLIEMGEARASEVTGGSEHTWAPVSAPAAEGQVPLW